jgi:S1-C subfamily serine protease
LRFAELLLVAIVGALLALGGAALFGKLGSSTTIQQVSPLGGGGVGVGSVSLQAPTHGLTPEQVYRRDSPGVVQITATSVSQGQTGESLGSGFLVDKTGHVVTNFHVIKGAQRIQVSFSGRDEINATLVGSDQSTDTAVLKIDAHARALNPLPLGNSDAVIVGDPVYAIGNPFGFTRTFTSGVVSAVQRQIEAPNTLQIDHAIQTDAAINHGNSGGPLIDAAGRVIGVTSQISTGSTGQQGNVGIGFAIPINTVRDVAAQIISTGKAQHAFLGIETDAITPQLARLFHLPVKQGLIVRDVDSGSAAAKAGIVAGATQVVVQGQSYLIGGDIIVSIDGTPLTSFDQLRDAIARHKPGDKVELETYHHGSKRSVTATLSNRSG